MYSKAKFTLVLFITAILFAKCSSALYQPTIEDAVITQTSVETLVAGRKLYVAKCGSCHSLYLPQQYSKDEWKIYLDEMQKRTKISDQQKDTIALYLFSRSKE